MKLNVNLGSELKHVTNLTYPLTVPVMKNDEVIGKCTIDSEGNGEINIVNEEEYQKIQHILELGVGGIVTSREGNTITGFDLKEVSIQWNEKYKVYPKTL